MAWNDQNFPWQGVPLNLQQLGVANQFSDYAIGQGFDPSSYYYTGGGDLQRLMAQLGMSPDQARGQVDAARLRNSDDALVQELGEQVGTKTLLDWFNANGYELQGVDTGDKWIQQLRGPDGSVIGTDTFDVAADNRSVDRFAAAAAALIGGAAAYGGLGGVGAAGSGAGSAAGGTGTLGAGSAGAGITTASLPANITAGLGLSNAAPLALAPSIIGPGAATAASAAAAAEMAAAIPGISTTGLGAEVTNGLGLGNVEPLQLADKNAFANLLGEKAMEGSIFDLIGSKEMGAIGSGIGSAGTTLGDIASGIGSLVGGPNGIGSVVAPILGAIGGAADAKKPDTMTQDRKMDPRMDAFVYGTGPNDTNSLLGAAQQWFNQNRSGTNADMTAGMDMLRSLYTSPQYQQGYNNMRNVGQGLMNITPAGNPFTQGLLQTPQMGNPFGGQAPTVNLGGLLQPRTFG